MPRSYPPEFRRKVLDLVEAGRKVAHVARDLGISDQSISTWRQRDRIDRGLELGQLRKAELAPAKRRIAQLDTELAITKRDRVAERRGLPKGGSKVMAGEGILVEVAYRVLEVYGTSTGR